MTSDYKPNIEIFPNSNNLEMICSVKKHNTLIVSSFLDEGRWYHLKMINKIGIYDIQRVKN